MATRTTTFTALCAPALILAPALLLGACAGGRDTFPSLARRASENAYTSASAPVAAPTAPAQVSADLPATLAKLRETALAAHRAFADLKPSATRTITAASGAARGSEAWSVAEIALAQLDSSRAQAMVALADLDRLSIVAHQTAVEGPDADLKAIESVRSEVSGLVSAENESVEALSGRLAG